MSRTKYNEECPGCLPVLIDTKTGNVFSADHPTMKSIMALWGHADRKTRKAWHAVTCMNSRRGKDMALVRPFVEKIQAAMASGPNPWESN